MTEALIQFLRDRLNEDEQVARSAGDGWYSYDPEQQIAFVSPEDSRHIARHDPARILREVEAKRVLLADYERFVAERRRMMGGWDSYPKVSPVLTAFAAVYADHPDCDEAWRP